MLADLPYFLAAHSADIFGMSLSGPNGHLPLYLMTAIALVVGMTLAHSPPDTEDRARRFGFVGAGAVILAVWILLGFAFIVGMANWLHRIQSLAPDEAPHSALVPMFVGSSWVLILNPYVCAVFVGLVAWCVVLSQRSARFSNSNRDAANGCEQ